MPARDPDNSRVRVLPAAKLILCEKCKPACHYLDRCPTHGPVEEEDPPASTKRQWQWPSYDDYMYLRAASGFKQVF